jgi:N6-adenosine-specific RNA methylase IME4
VGVSHDLVEMALWLMENAPLEELERLRRGERAISNLYRETKRWRTVEELRRKAESLKAPEGLYDVIVVDPPWPYGTEYDPEGRRCASPYPEMSLEELKRLRLPANENCVLWLWTTNAFMHEAFHLLEAWGFEPKTILTWVKDRIGLGDWLRGQTEHCIMAVRGRPTIRLTNQSTALFAKAGPHSRKPDEFYRLVETLCPGSKLDYFGRETREGWAVYGTLENQRRVGEEGD